jgi:HSP20 family protein
MLRFPEDLALRVPPVDIYEEGGSIVVKAELPGVKKGEIDIRVSGNALPISGKGEGGEGGAEGLPPAGARRVPLQPHITLPA